MATITILLGPAGSGKTAAALAELTRPRQGRAVLLLPGGLHRRRLADQLALSPRLRAGPFGLIARYVLRLAGAPTDLASAATRLALLRAELEALTAAGRLPYLGSVATRGGVVAAALRLIDELRAAETPPAALAGAGVGPYDPDLALAYAAYNTALARHALGDEHGLLALARDVLREGRAPGLRLALLVVDGFDQFTPVQLGLLGALAGRAERTVVTLTGEREPRPAHSRYARTLAALRATLPEAALEHLPASGGLAPPFAQIERGLFAPAPPPPADPAGALAVIRAPDREREVRAALRRVKALLAAGAAAETVALLYRSGAPYLPLVREVAAEYGLPLALYEGMALGEAPPSVALRGLLQLPVDGFPRRALAESWRALGATRAASQLERATVGAGRSLARMRAALLALADAPPPRDPDDPAGPPVTPAEAAALLAELDAFVAWLTPPEVETPGAFVAWVRGLLGWGEGGRPGAGERGSGGDLESGVVGHLTCPSPWPALARRGGSEEPGPANSPSGMAPLTFSDPLGDQGRELLPFTREQRVQLRQILAEREAIGRLLGEGPRPYAAFVAELGGALDGARYGGQRPEPGRVAVMPFLAARGHAFDHVIMLGMSDGTVPARLPEPPFYTRRERALLAARGAAPPPADPGDERSIFYEAALRARRSLTLAYTRLDEGGNPLEPSPYLHALVGLFDSSGVPVASMLAGSAPDPAEPASPQEALIAAAAAGALAQPPAGVPPAVAAHVARAATIEAQREGGAPLGPYEGALDHPAVVAALARRFGPEHLWSATQINNYTICPFRFAAAHLLRLAHPDDPDEGLAQVGRGQVAHAILASAGRAWARLEGAFDASNEAPILAALAAAADEVLAAAPERFGFEPGPLWAWEQYELGVALARAVARALRAEGWAGFRPAGVEEGFGVGKGMAALRVQTPAGEALVTGRIDRVDQDADGNLALIDYKSGSTARSLRETVAGRDVQLTLYALAAEGLGQAGQRVVRAAYLTLGNGRLSQPLTPAERPAAEAALRERLGAAMAGARTGAFLVKPSDGCPPACAFAGVCRVNPSKAAQAEQGSSPQPAPQ